ncbi:MAG: YraN family protein [Flavobacteriales bacterium]|nr:YraN family protein [Flavobacteriales bacterium]
MAKHNKLGEEGEEIACALLREKGYKIAERNWRTGKLELDIIATKDNTLVVVEVKTRTGNVHGDPEDFVTRPKQRHIIKATNEYILQKDWNEETRFDIISIIMNGKETKVEHLENAFYPLA